MLKIIFWLLLGLNAGLYALAQGYLGSYRAEEHEPERIRQQLNASQITLAPPADAPAPAPAPAGAAPAAPATGDAPAKASAAATFAAASALPVAATSAPPPAKPAQALLCTEIGDFTAAEARKFETRLAALGLGERVSKQAVTSQEISSYIVHIPPLANKEAADRKAAELKELGVSNFFVIPESGPMHYAISLGVFKSEAGAQTLLASLVKQGVQSARVSPRYSASKQQAFRIEQIDAATKARVDQVKAAFPEQKARACK